MSLSSFGVRKPVVPNLLTFAIIGAGLVFGLGLRREFFPEVRPNQVLIAAPYPGASPDEIERALAIKIEDAIVDLRGVKEINTTVVEGAASVLVEFLPGIAIDDAVARVKRRIDGLQDLPERAERITVEDFEPRIPVITLSLFGESDERVMKEAIREMRDDLRALPGMGDITLSGVRRDEIAVETTESALLEHGLGLTTVAERIGRAMAEIPGGAIRSTTSDIALRTVPTAQRAEEIRRIVVVSGPGGAIVRLGDIASVRETFADVDLLTRLNGEPAASLTVYAAPRQDAIDIADMVKAYAAGRLDQPLPLRLPERLRSMRDTGEPPSTRVQAYELGRLRGGPPPGELSLHTDLARFISQRLDLLSRNALAGGVLVFLTLLVFLTPTVAFWVTSGLVISVLGTLVLMHFLNISLNLLTMFGLIIVLGLLVDDAIVVAENITARHERGEPALAAATAGAQQVSWPVVATVLTTIFAFMPLRMIEGRIGDLMGALPIVVACALFVSLIESLLILPAHVGHSLARSDRLGPGRLHRAGVAMEAVRSRILQRGLAPAYARLLDVCLRRRYLSMAAALAVLIGSLGMVAGGRVPFTFFAAADSETVLVELTMPIGTPLSETDAVTRRIEAASLGMPEVQTAFTLVGARQDLEGGGGVVQGNRAQLFLELRPVEERERASDQVIVAIQEALGPIPGAKSLRFEEAQGGPGGSAITLTAVGDDSARLAAVADAIATRLREFDGVYGVATDADAGRRELRVELRDGADELGFTTDGIGRQLRGAVYGLEAYTFAGDREDVDVRVMLDESARRSPAAIESLNVFSQEGLAVPLAEIARIYEDRGFATVRRLDRERAVTVTVDVDRDRANPESVVATLGPFLERLQEENPGVRILPRGRQLDMADSFRTLPLGMLAAVALIYVTLTWLFSSYVQPLLILCALPFALIGVVWGHFILRFDMTILSMIGFVALAGIVVNDALVYMNFFNEKRAQGHAVMDAAMVTGRERLRAILLTTITTVLGLAPLMLEQSFQARFLIPMAITISFGLMSATVLTLLILPCMLVIGDDIRRIARRAWWGPGEGEFSLETSPVPDARPALGLGAMGPEEGAVPLADEPAAG